VEPNVVVSRSCENNQDVGLWRIAMSTVARTLLAFTVPYIVGYYSVMGAWQGFQLLRLWVDGPR
jgi:hypothetical protein